MDNADRLDRGEQAFSDGDYRAAVIDAKDVLLDEPDSLRGRLLLGRASVKTGNGPAAEKELRTAMRLGARKVDVAAELAQALLLQRKFDEVVNEIPLNGLPSADAEAIVRQSRGDAYVALNQPVAAREMYSLVLEAHPENLNARLGIVRSFVGEKNIAQARGGIEQILQTDADNPRVWLFSGSFNSRFGNLEAAEANFAVALKLAGEQGDDEAREEAAKAIRLEAMAGLAESLLDQQDVDSAREHIETLAALAPETVRTMSLIARLAYHDEDWKTAQQNLQRIVRVAPDYLPAQMLLGAVHAQSGNLAQAEMYLSRVVAAAPDNVRARQLLAETKLRLRKGEEAQLALAPILSGPNADSISLQMAARASLSREDVDEALKYLRQNIEANPGNADLRFQLAVTLLQAGRVDEAQAVLDEIDVSGSDDNAYRRDALVVLTAVRDRNQTAALASAEQLVADYSNRSGAHILLGNIQLATGDLESSTKSFEKVIDLEPKNVLAQRSLAEIEESTGDLESAKVRYTAILAEQPDTAWAMFALGRIAYRQESYQEAADNFRRATEAAPTNATFRLGLARMENEMGNTSTASSILESDMESSLQHIPSGIMLGMLKAKEGDTPGAINIAKELQRRHPDESTPFAFEGEIYLKDGDFTRADQAYDKALSTSVSKNHALRSHSIKRRLKAADPERPLIAYLEERPLDTDVRAMLAESYMQANNLDKSIEVYESIVAEAPTNGVLLNNLAWAYFLADDPRAMDTARKASDAMPENGAIVDTLGWIMVQKGSVEEGEKVLRRAVELENGRSEIRYHHAMALVKMGRTDEARKTLQEILADDEEFAGRSDVEKALAGL